jgi:ribokinase
MTGQEPASASLPQIVVIGSHAPGLLLRVKRIPKPGETVIGWGYEEPQDGGKGTNQAIAAARLGDRVAFVGRVGRDRIGDQCEDWLRNEEIDTRFLMRSGATASGVGFIILDAAGVPAMVTAMGANAELSCEDVDAALDTFAGARLLLTQFEIDPQVALHAAREARRRGMLTIVNPAPAPETMLSGLDAADILVPNDTEAKVLIGLDPAVEVEPEKLALELLERSGAGKVVVTLGEQGVAGAEGGQSWRVSAPRVAVVDTSGAGDAFCAGLAHGLLQGFDLYATARWACAAATLSVTRPGTISAYPTIAEVESFLTMLDIDC